MLRLKSNKLFLNVAATLCYVIVYVNFVKASVSCVDSLKF